MIDIDQLTAEYEATKANPGDGPMIAASGVTAIRFADGTRFLDDRYEPVHAEPPHFAAVDGKAVYQYPWTCSDHIPADLIPEAWLVGADGKAACCTFAEPIAVGTAHDAVDPSTDWVELGVGMLAW